MEQQDTTIYKFYKKSHNERYLKRLMKKRIRENGTKQKCCQNKFSAKITAISPSTLKPPHINNISILQNIENKRDNNNYNNNHLISHDSSKSIFQNTIENSHNNTHNNIQLVSHNNSESNKMFINHLRYWTIGHHIAQTAISDLLKIIKVDLKLHWLPSDARSILKTENINDTISTLHPRKYYHFGIKSKLILKLIQNDFKGDKINISLNIDGLPLTKSSGSQFWPILIKIDELEEHEPFPVAVYHGKHKPSNSNLFLQKFVEEMKSLQEEGLNLNGKILKLTISKILCDAPAKSFILCVKNFNSYQSCTKCWTEGVFQNNRMTFPELDSKLRTNEEFYSQTDEDYHKGTSVLCNLGLDLVTRVPLDYMHLVLLGVMKRLLGFWIKGNQAVRLFKEDIELINEKLELVYKSIPCEFSRKPGQITEYEKWKSVEFRTFLLYYGPWIMKSVLKNQYFLHFLSLHCAIRILICDKLIEKYIDYAHELLIYFVREFGNLYGNEYVNHNIHNLIHLTLDVKNFGSLDKFSCFPFEMNLINMLFIK